MACRTFDRILKCGCMISSDGGGGLIPCYAEYGNTKRKKDRDALDLHNKCWKEWMKSADYKKHLKEVKERNS